MHFHTCRGKMHRMAGDIRCWCATFCMMAGVHSGGGDPVPARFTSPIFDVMWAQDFCAPGIAKQFCTQVACFAADTWRTKKFCSMFDFNRSCSVSQHPPALTAWSCVPFQYSSSAQSATHRHSLESQQPLATETLWHGAHARHHTLCVAQGRAIGQNWLCSRIVRLAQRNLP
jgi:hypothetical protein